MTFPDFASPHFRTRAFDLTPLAMIIAGAAGCAWPYVAEVVW